MKSLLGLFNSLVTDRFSLWPLHPFPLCGTVCFWPSGIEPWILVIPYKRRLTTLLPKMIITWWQLKKPGRAQRKLLRLCLCVDRKSHSLQSWGRAPSAMGDRPRTKTVDFNVWCAVYRLTHLSNAYGELIMCMLRGMLIPLTHQIKSLVMNKGK